MTERTQNLMQQIWNARNSGADTEEKLVASILELAAEAVQCYTAQNQTLVLDKNDLLQIAKELKDETD
jgi:NTP pyrophosphatase (non-canonical NTP hydrolase)